MSLGDLTTFKKINGELNGLIEGIDSGDIKLPELQRPFVWRDAKVRDLLDSMYRGYPIGYFLFWENQTDEKTRMVGERQKSHAAKLLILDGQQRLTALYAIFKNSKVLDDEYEWRKIQIAFNPITEEFKVSDASTERNQEFIDDVSELFGGTTFSFINEYLQKLKQYTEISEQRKQELVEKIKSNVLLKTQEVEFLISRIRQGEQTEHIIHIITKLKDKIELGSIDKEKLLEHLSVERKIDNGEIGKRIEKLANLIRYPYQALEIKNSVEEENVAEIFTRINSGGMKLGQSDFILTLISVIWPDGRKQIEQFCQNCKMNNQELRESPFNYIFYPDPGDIVRMIANVAFRRARLREAYLLLKGRDLKTRTFSTDIQEKNVASFQDALKLITDNTAWHGFLKILIGLGFKSNELISSKAAIGNSYIFYLIGKQLGLDHRTLDKTVAKWFFMAQLTSRYSFSPETQMEADLSSIKDCKTGLDLVNFVEKTITHNLTNDFWNVTLPKDLLVTSSSTSPAGNSFFACLIQQKTHVLFSSRTVSDLFDPSLRLRKKMLDRHHLFPRKYLESLNYEQKMINQIANMTYLEFQDNIEIGARSPEDYFTEAIEKHYSGKEKELYQMLTEHCIPKEFYKMKYEEFLDQRRILVAQLIRKVFESI